MNRQLIDFDSDHIALPACAIGPQLCAELCTALSANDSVNALDLSRNSIGDEGAESIARLLAANRHIASLNLSHNGITDAGVILIARAARRHGALQMLNLANNPIGDAGLAEITRLVAVSDQIRELALLDTSVSVRGAMGLAEAMVRNTTLIFVSLPFSLGFTVLDEVQRLLSRNFARTSGLDDQIRLAAAAAKVQQSNEAARQRQWKPTQPNAEHHTSRTRVLDAPLQDWSDGTQRSTLIYLNLLSKRAKQVVHDERVAAAQVSAPRGRGIAGLSPRAMESVVVSAGPCSSRTTPRGSAAASNDGRTSARLGGSSTSGRGASGRYVSLPPLPNNPVGFTSSFQSPR